MLFSSCSSIYYVSANNFYSENEAKTKISCDIGLKSTNLVRLWAIISRDKNQQNMAFHFCNS